MAERGRAPGRARGYAGTWPERGATRAEGFVPSGLGVGASFIAKVREWAAEEAGAGRLLSWVPVAFSVGIAFYFTADHEPVGWIAEHMARIWGGGAAYRIDETTSHPHEAHYLKLDCSKARSRLSWQPRWDLSRALAEVVSWHRAYLERDDLQDVCLQQISRFCEA